MTTRKYSRLTARELYEFIDKVVGFGDLSDFDVFVAGRDHDIVVIHRETGVNDSINAARVFNAAPPESANDADPS